MNVLVTGAAGSGTSTLGRALAAHFDVAFLEADDFFWLPTLPPYTHKRSPVERAALLREALNVNGSSVVAGSVMGWGPKIEDAFHLVVFLHVATEVRLARLQQREKERFGQVRPEFLEWASQYEDGPPEGRSLAKHNSWLAARQCHVIRLTGNYTVKELLSQLEAQWPNPSLNRTRNGMPRLGLISFWPKRVTPLRAG